MVLYRHFKRSLPPPPLNLNDITSRRTQLAGQMVIGELDKELGIESAQLLEGAGKVVDEASAKFTVAA